MAPPAPPNPITWEELVTEQLARSGFHIPPPPPPPKAPPWTATNDTQAEGTKAQVEMQRPATAINNNDGDPTHHLIPESRKRGASSTQNDLQFHRSSSPLTKRAVLRTTPEKMKQHVSDIAVANMLDTLDISTTSKGLTETQRKYQSVFKGLMAPSGAALNHPAAPLLLELATLGCPADIGEAWTLEMLEEAIRKGAHPSAMEPEPAAQLRAETLEKVEQGYARLVAWDSVKHNPPKTLKISPIAAIPHKSRGFRMILDLSHGVTIAGTRFPSVNEATNPTRAPNESMAELGNVLPRLIFAVATAPDAQGPILFSKLDIKDGYWRMVVPEEAEWNFAYVLPKLQPDDPVQLVIPSSLQMGWCDSPAYFCAASETARDVAETLTNTEIGSLEQHPLEHYLIPPMQWPEQDLEQNATKFTHLLEVYIDDFIQLAQTCDPTRLTHLSRALLHAIHAVFPPPAITGHDGEDPVSLKKLRQGEGTWDTRKEILGWVFDGARRCIELPDSKVERLTSELQQMARKRMVPRKLFEQLRGRLRHACIGIPAGKGLMGPIDAALRGDKRWIRIKGNQLLRDALQDFATIIKVLGQRPTHCRELVATEPGYVGFCDASTLGAGGVWFAGTKSLNPIVWRVEWPEDIRNNVVSFGNPNGTITNSDLEMAGMVLHYVVLEHLVDLRHVHVAAWCDNTPTVSWTNKLSSSKSTTAGRLTRALAMRIHANHASPLVSVSIAGVQNVMADVASRTFSRHTVSDSTFKISDSEFLQMFASKFPLQDTSWNIFRLSNKLSSRVFSELRGQTSTLGSWLRLTTKGSAIGRIGKPTSNRSITWTPCSPTSQSPHASISSSASLAESAVAITGMDVKSALAPYRSRYVPSARPSNWRDCPTQPTAVKDGTG